MKSGNIQVKNFVKFVNETTKMKWDEMVEKYMFFIKCYLL